MKGKKNNQNVYVFFKIFSLFYLIVFILIKKLFIKYSIYTAKY